MDPDLGWRSLCPALRRVDLVGDHYEVFSAENVAVVASGMLIDDHASREASAL
jgi:hypothetical protein